jgi:hypothetical protein
MKNKSDLIRSAHIQMIPDDSFKPHPARLRTTDLNYLAFYFLTALFFTGEAAFFATFLAGAFLAGAFIAGAGFLAAGLAEAFFAAGISYPPFHSAVAEDKK